MACAESSFNKPIIRFQWMWNSNANPFSKSEPSDWCPYSDIDNMIIEEAFTAGKTHALLDDYSIDLEGKLQISNSNIQKQRPVQRVECDKVHKCLREKRFLPNPVAPDRPFGDQYGFISPFIIEVVKYLKLTKEQLPSINESIVPMIVEKAALGIIEEGKKIGQRIKAEYIANLLIEEKDSGMKDVWRWCAYLYSIDSFLFKKLNETMRLIGSEQHEKVWRSKVATLGPFCLLLWDNPFNSKMTKPGRILYRGAHLNDDLINSFKEDCSTNPRPWHSFQAFTSCSLNRNLAEIFGNVVFIMTTQIAFTADIQPISSIPEEEEELLYPGVSFAIDRMDYDEVKQKHLIYLTLQQKRNNIDKPRLNCNSIQLTENINIDSKAERDVGDFFDDRDFDNLTNRFKFLLNIRRSLAHRNGRTDLDSINPDNPREFDYFLRLRLDRDNRAANFDMNDSVADRAGFDDDWNEE